MSGVQQGFHLVAIPCQKLLFFVPRQGTVRAASLFQNCLALVFEADDLVSWQGISQSKRDKVNCALVFEMRQFATKM